MSDLIPWVDGHDDAQREHIENKDTPEDFVDGFLDGGLRIMRFTRSDADDLDAKIGIHDHDKCHQGAGKPFGKKPPFCQRFAMPVAMPPLPMPKTIMPMPLMIMKMMVQIFTRANQNSNSP